MWTALSESAGKDVTKYRITANGKPVAFRKVIDLWKTSKEFIKFFIGLLKSSSYQGFFWEVKPTASENLDEEFEFVLVNSPILPALVSDSTPFAPYFVNVDWVVSMPNLGGDAVLIIPVQKGDASHYSHLANFVRNAPAEQIEIFWNTVGEEFDKAIGVETKWLSTAGLGVSWLHVRIDSRPKYYRYQAYKIAR